MTHLWSTLRLGTWTEIENVDIWLDRSRQGLLTVKIDPQKDVRMPSSDPPYAGLQHALRSMDRWKDLELASSPAPEIFGGAMNFQTAEPMGQLVGIPGGGTQMPWLHHSDSSAGSYL